MPRAPRGHRGPPLLAGGLPTIDTVAATPAAVNAVIDALAPFGVRDIALPLTRERVWRAIREARGG